MGSSPVIHLLDCLVIGGGAAGLTAAVYLGRFRRNIVVVDAGASRLSLIPTSHNYPGFPEGVTGTDMLVRLRAQASEYGARIVSGTIEQLERLSDGTFLAILGEEHFVPEQCSWRRVSLMSRLNLKGSKRRSNSDACVIARYAMVTKL